MAQTTTIVVEPAIVIGGVPFFFLDTIAAAFGCDRRCLINACRDGHFSGRKIGVQYVVTGEEFQRFVNGDNFSFKPRPARQPKADS